MKRKLLAISIITLMVFSVIEPGVIKNVNAATVKVGKVAGVKISSIKTTSATIKWSKVKNAKKYQVTYSTNKTFKGAKTKTLTKTSLTVKSLKQGTKYYSKIRAVSKTGYKGSWSSVKSFATKSIENKLTKKTGYFYLKIVGNEKTTNMKVNVKFKATDISDKPIDVTYSSSGTNNHSFGLSSSEEKTDIASNDYYGLLNVDFEFTNPAHYGANVAIKGSVSKYCIVENPGYFSSSGYIIGCYHSLSSDKTTGTIKLNASDVGAIKVNGKEYHATITINLTSNYGGLVVDPNGGSWKYGSETYTSITDVKWAGKCGTTMNIPNPTRNGYVFMGWTTTENSNNSCSYGTLKGSVYKNMNTNITTSSSTFTFCGEATSLADAKKSSSKCYTTLTAMWKKQ